MSSRRRPGGRGRQAGPRGGTDADPAPTQPSARRRLGADSLRTQGGQRRRPPLIEWPWSPAWTADGLDLHVERVVGDCGPHQHPFHEIALVARGSGTHEDACGTSAMRTGDLLVLHPQAWHAYPDGARLQVYNCVFRTGLPALLPFADELGPAARLLRRWPRPLARPPLRLRADERTRRELVRLFEAMIAERRRRAPGWRAALLARLVEALVVIGRLPAADAPRPHADDPRVEAVQRWLAERFREPIPSAAGLAARAGLSPGRFSRRFAACSGVPLVAWIHQLRVEEACRLLRGGALPITAVARRVGFGDPAYFTRIFTRLVGCPPRAYRRGPG